MLTVQTNFFKPNCQYNFSQKQKSYELYSNEDFLDGINVPSGADIVEKTIDEMNKQGVTIDKSNVFYSLGETFENAQVYKTARDFFQKNMEFLVKNKRNQNEINELQYDIDRTNEKLFTSNKIDVEG